MRNHMEQDGAKPANGTDTIISHLLHDLRPPLKMLHYFTEELHNRSAGMDAEQMRRYLNELSKAIEELVHASSAIFSWLEVQRSNFIQPPESIDLNQFLAQIRTTFMNQNARHWLQVNVKAEGGVQARNDAHAISLLLQQLLRNATLQKESGTITVGCWREAVTTYFAVTDQGSGMSPQLTNNIQAHLSGATSEPILFRYGYRVIIQVLQLLGGTITFRNRAPSGTEVVVALPDMD